MKKHIQTFTSVFALVCMTSLTACQQKTPTEEKIKTSYIGDNSKVSQIAGSLPYPKGVSFDSMEIQSSKEPYELKIFVKVNSNQSFDMKKCADEAFDRIQNMGIISFYTNDTNSLVQTFPRK